MRLRVGICFAVILLSITSVLSSQSVQSRVVGNGTPASCTEAALDAALDAGGLITFNCGGAVTIPFTSTKTLTTNKPDVTIDGGGLVTFTANSERQLFRVNAGKTLKLLNLRLEQGYSKQNGGAILNSGTVEITSSLLSGNSADFNGGAIASTGTLNLIKTSFKDNFSSFSGGAIFNDAGGQSNIIGTSFENNFSSGDGGAIYVNGNVTLNSVVNVANSTFFGNMADNGGAIYAFGANATVNITHGTFTQNTGFESASTLGKDAAAFILVRNSILTAPGAGNHCSFGILEQGGNIVHGASCEGIANPVSTGDPLLGAAEGSPAYFPLNPGSPAVNAVGNCTYLSMGENPLFNDGNMVEIDQRWFARPANNLCDTGAYEAGAIPAVLTITPTPSDTPTITNTLTQTETPEFPVETETPTETMTHLPTTTFTIDPTATPSTSTPDTTPMETPSMTETQSSEATSTPEPTPMSTTTGTPQGTATLSVNGSFELDADDDKLPDGWTLKHGDSAKRKCNKDTDNDGEDDKIVAFDGRCAFQFKGQGKLRQNIVLENGNAGDTLLLDGYYAAKGSVISAKAKVTVKYPAAPKGKITFNITTATGEYTPFTGERSLTLEEQPAAIRLQLQSASGRIRFDGISLTYTSDAAGLIPLP
jgi:predicted outer membrane repeat protein